MDCPSMWIMYGWIVHPYRWTDGSSVHMDGWILHPYGWMDGSSIRMDGWVVYPRSRNHQLLVTLERGGTSSAAVPAQCYRPGGERERVRGRDRGSRGEAEGRDMSWSAFLNWSLHFLAVRSYILYIYIYHTMTWYNKLTCSRWHNV